MANNAADSQMGDVLDALERKIFLLRNEYEQYFLGFVKKEPSDKRDEVENIFRHMSRQRITNTSYNFRLQQLKARLSTLSLYWTRTVRQIEEGTFRRDKFRLKLRIREEEEHQLAQKSRADENRRSEDARRAAEARATIRDTVSDPDMLKSLYQEFVQTRQRCQERVDNVQFDKMVDFMHQQTHALKERFKCQAVQFQVVEDGGKAKLKATPVR